MSKNLANSPEILASKQASKQASKRYIIIDIGWAVPCPDGECPCLAVAQFYCQAGIFYVSASLCHPEFSPVIQSEAKDLMNDKNE